MKPALAPCLLAGALLGPSVGLAAGPGAGGRSGAAAGEAPAAKAQRPDRTTADIVAALRGADDGRRAMAVSVVPGLTEGQQRALLGPVVGLVADRRASVAARRAAVDALGGLALGDPDELARLAAVVRAPREPIEVRQPAADLLLLVARRFPQAVVARPLDEPLLEVVERRGDPEGLRETAAAALSVVPRALGRRAIERLAAVYSDRSQAARVRGGALLCLGSLEGAARPQLPALRRVLADAGEDLQLRRVTAMVVERVKSAASEQAPEAVPEKVRRR